MWSCFLLPLAAQQDFPLGTWRNHLPYNEPTCIAQAGNRYYCGTNNSGVFYYDADDNELRGLSTIEGLSEIGVQQLAYSDSRQLLFIAYQNSNIDILLQNGAVKNVSDLKEESMSGDKNIYDIMLTDSLAYLATGFGIVVMDLEDFLIRDTYYIGNNNSTLRCYALAQDANLLMAATENGVYYAPSNAELLFSSETWSRFDETEGLPTDNVRHLVYINQTFYAADDTKIYRYNGNGWENFYALPATWSIQNMSANGEKLIVCENHAPDNENITEARIAYFDAVTSFQSPLYLQAPTIYRPREVVFSASTQTFWIADFYAALTQASATQVLGQYSINAPGSNVLRMAVKKRQVYVAPGGVAPNGAALYNRDGFYRYNTENYWENYNLYNTSFINDNGLYDFIRITNHPTQDITYFGMNGKGLLEWKPEGFTLYNASNSALRAATGDPNAIKICGVEWDKNQNLWIANYGAEKPIVVKTAAGEWLSFDNGNVFSTENSFFDVAIDGYNNKWFLVRTNGIVVYDSGDDIADDNDDRYRWLTTTSADMPTNDILCMQTDRDGEVWIGTADGVVVFYCGYDIFNTACKAEQPIVDINGKLARLLDGERVLSIAVDGANRKWIGSESGLYLISADGREQLAAFNRSNSPLPSNIIKALAIDHESGELFIGTDKGIVSYKADATQGARNFDNILVYPNPVRPDYEGDIAIKGLIEDAQVKITDISGRLVYETTALGGQAIWNGKTYEGKRVQTGVYLVLATNADGSEAAVAKIFMIH